MIAEFRGRYGFLSNFWPDGNVERKYQAAKFPHYPRLQRMIMNSRTPGDAKRLARKFDALKRKDWNEVSLSIMLGFLREKFSVLEMKKGLLDTGDEYLQEGNWWGDVFFGVDLGTGKGENYQGKLLMQVRGELRGDE